MKAGCGLLSRHGRVNEPVPGANGFPEASPIERNTSGQTLVMKRKSTSKAARRTDPVKPARPLQQNLLSAISSSLGGR